MKTINMVIAAGLFTMGVGVLLVNLARDPPRVLTGMWITLCGALVSVAAGIFEVTGHSL